jgi:hypothetical protein
MKQSSRCLRLALLGGVALVFGVAESYAIPTFARRYATSCATCHEAYPRLNAVGDSFRMMGFRFPDDERYRKVQPVELGDEAYKRLWPKALWPSHIPGKSPLSLITRFMFEVDLNGSRQAATTFLLPEEIELVWAGNLGENIAFYGDVIYLQKDFGGKDPESWATLKGWLQLQSLFGRDHLFNLRIGTVGTQTMGLFTARDANIYSTHFYIYTSWFMPRPNLVQAGLSEFQGNNFSITPQQGFELNGVGKKWFYALGVVNGNLLVPAGSPPPSDISFVGSGRNTDPASGWPSSATPAQPRSRPSISRAEPGSVRTTSGGSASGCSTTSVISSGPHSTPPAATTIRTAASAGRRSTREPGTSKLSGTPFHG